MEPQLPGDNTGPQSSIQGTQGNTPFPPPSVNPPGQSLKDQISTSVKQAFVYPPGLSQNTAPPIGMVGATMPPQVTMAAGQYAGTNMFQAQSATALITGQQMDFKALSAQIADAVKEGVTDALSGTTSGPSVGSSSVPVPQTPFAPGKPSGSLAEGHVRQPKGLEGLFHSITNKAGLSLNQAGRTNFAPPVTQQNGQWYKSAAKDAIGAELVSKTFGHGVPITAGEAGTLATRGAVLDSATGLIGGIGGMLPGGLGGLASAAPEGALIAGLPLAAYEGANFIANQRQQNAYYQSILGGSNMGGLDQRVQQAGFRFSTMGDLSGAQANQLFQGVTNLDMTGNQRNNALLTSIGLYNQLGMSVSDSLQTITIAAQSSNQELTGVAQALDTVTQAAVQGQVNANVARQNFNNLYASTTQNIQGSGATAVASGISASQAGLGKMFQGANFSGLTSQSTLLMVAAQSGMSYGQLVGGMESGTINYGKELQNNTLNNILSSQGVTDAVQEAASRLGYGTQLANGTLSQGQLGDIAEELNEISPNLGLTLPQSLNGLLGTSMTSVQAMNFAVASITGNLNLAKNVAKATPQYKTKPVKKPLTNKESQQLSAAQASAARYRKAGQKVPKSVTDRINFLQSSSKALSQFYDEKNEIKANKAVGSTGNVLTDIFGRNSTEEAREWYLKNVASKGETDPVMENLLKNPDINNKDTIFQVQTDKGPRNVGIQDLQQYYMKQVQAGTPKIVSSSDNNLIGRTIEKSFPGKYNKLPNGQDQRDPKAVQSQQTTLDKTVKATQAHQFSLRVEPSSSLVSLLKFISNSGDLSVSNNANLTPPAQYPPVQLQAGNNNTFNG